MPYPSCPGTNGGRGFTGQSPCAACKSVWQTPDVSSLTSASPKPGTGQLEFGNLQRRTEFGDDGGPHDVGACGWDRGVNGLRHRFIPVVKVVARDRAFGRSIRRTHALLL